MAQKIIIYQGYRFNQRTLDMLHAAELVSPKGTPWTIFQGSYNAGKVWQSGGTHDGGGALDVSPYDWGNRVKALRTVGFAAWHRPYLRGYWGEHIHCIAIGDPDLSNAAADQVKDFYAGRNGLANNGPDDGPAVLPIQTWGQYQAAHSPPVSSLAGRQLMYSSDSSYDKPQPLVTGKWVTLQMSTLNTSVLWESMTSAGAIEYSLDARVSITGLPAGKQVAFRSRRMDATTGKWVGGRKPVDGAANPGTQSCQYVECAGKLNPGQRLRIQAKVDVGGVTVTSAGVTATYWKA